MRTHRQKHAGQPTKRLSKFTRSGRTARITPAAIMKHLKVAKEICRDVQASWDYNLIERQRGSYCCKFPCPECGKEAQETMTIA